MAQEETEVSIWFVIIIIAVLAFTIYKFGGGNGPTSGPGDADLFD
ncbi:hypothetical protein [Tenacibaculum jejuense]|nr:hypothetical protein [Tenacibaculum jejuense]